MSQAWDLNAWIFPSLPSGGSTCLCIGAFLQLYCFLQPQGAAALYSVWGPEGPEYFPQSFSPGIRLDQIPHICPSQRVAFSYSALFPAVDCRSLVLSVRSRVPERFLSVLPFCSQASASPTCSHLMGLFLGLLPHLRYR